MNRIVSFDFLRFVLAICVVCRLKKVAGGLRGEGV